MLLNCSHILFFFFLSILNIFTLGVCKFTNDRLLQVYLHSEIFTLALLSVVLKLGCLDARWRLICSTAGYKWARGSTESHDQEHLNVVQTGTFMWSQSHFWVALWKWFGFIRCPDRIHWNIDYPRVVNLWIYCSYPAQTFEFNFFTLLDWIVKKRLKMIEAKMET